MALLTCHVDFASAGSHQVWFPLLGPHMCAFFCVLSYVCSPVCAFICVLSSVCSHVSDMCSHMSSPLCSHLCVIVLILTTTSLVSFCPPTLFGVSGRDNELFLLPMDQAWGWGPSPNPLNVGPYKQATQLQNISEKIIKYTKPSQCPKASNSRDIKAIVKVLEISRRTDDLEARHSHCAKIKVRVLSSCLPGYSVGHHSRTKCRRPGTG